MHDRGDRIEKGKIALAGQQTDRRGKGGRCQWSARDDHIVPGLWRQTVDFLANDRNERMPANHLGDASRKLAAVDRERTSCWQLMRIGGGQDEGIETPHFAMQNANRARLRIVGAKGIRTDEFGEVSCLMRRRLAHRPHLVNHDGDVLPCDLPGRLAAGKAAADHMDGSQGAGL